MHEEQLKLIAEVGKKIGCSQLMQMSPAEMLEMECRFAVELNGRLWFDEPLFAIHELLQKVKPWRDEGCRDSLRFCSMETEDNPLLCFVWMEQGWLLQSPWQRFPVQDAVIGHQTMVEAIDVLLQSCLL